MVQVPSKSLTLEEFLRLPETKPASEYIEGQIIQKPMPQGKHSRIQGELLAAINAVVKPERVACAFLELRCTYPSGSHPADVYGGRSTVPDIAVFTWNRIPYDDSGEVANAFSLTPDWTIEILSPDQSHTRVTKNIMHCLQHGTSVGWLIDPDEKTVFVYRPKQEIEIYDAANEVLLGPDFAGDLQLSVENMFAWLKI